MFFIDKNDFDFIVDLFGPIMIVAIFIACGITYGIKFIKPSIEIQEVKQVEDTYYITINNEIYEYEVEK